MTQRQYEQAKEINDQMFILKEKKGKLLSFLKTKKSNISITIHNHSHRGDEINIPNGYCYDFHERDYIKFCINTINHRIEELEKELEGI